MQQEKAWIFRTNVYEVNLRQYTNEGTLNAFLPHLPRLKDMGVEILWFMPLTPIAKVKKKGTLGSYYACTDYTSVDPEFGSLDDFRNLVLLAHAKGFKVIIDWVANHTGWDHVWTKTNPGYYKKDHEGGFLTASGMDDIIELDYDNAGLRRAMIDAMKFWINETGIDGFRCDLATWVELDFWVDAKKELETIRPLFMLGEFDSLDSPEYMQVFDVCYTWRWMHKTKEFYEKRPGLQPLLELLDHYTYAPGMKAWFTTNHDENSWNGTEYEKYGDAALMFAVFSATWPGIPLIYSGQELPNLKRLKFFDKDAIEWQAELKLHWFYETLLELRKQHASLNAVAANTVLATSRSSEVLAFRRSEGEDEILVFLNFTAGETDVNFSASQLNGYYLEVFTKEKFDLSTQKILRLQPWGYLVFEKA
jgi:alpha-amylase